MSDAIEFTITVGDNKLSTMGSPVIANALNFHTGNPFTVLDGPKVPTLQLTIDPKKSGDPETPQPGDLHRLTGTLWAKPPFERFHLFMTVKLHGSVVSVGQDEMVLNVVRSNFVEEAFASKDDPLQFGLGGKSVPFIQNFELTGPVKLRLKRTSGAGATISVSFETLHLVLRLLSAFHTVAGNQQFPLEAAGKRFVTELTVDAGPLLDSQDTPLAAATAFHRSMRFQVSDACLRMFLANPQPVFPDKHGGPPTPTAPIPKGPFAPGSLGPQFPKKP